MINASRLKLLLGAALVAAVALGQQASSGLVNFYGVITGVGALGNEFHVFTNPNADPQSAYKKEYKTVDFNSSTIFEGSAPEDLKLTRDVQVIGIEQEDGKILATKVVVYEGNSPVRARKDIPTKLPSGQTR
jgi:Domain of unknown function (DUF5666)